MLTIVVAACAPQEQSFDPPSRTQASLTADAFVTADGTALPMRFWLPKGKPKAVILAVHGFNDYSRAFEWPGRFFAARGIATYAYDQRGFGASKDIGIWAGEENLAEDLRQCAKLLKARYPNTPLYILGESMGAAVAISALANKPMPEVKGVILSAPAVWGGNTMNPFYRGSLWLVSHTIPFYTMTGEDLRIRASDNIEMLRALSADPLIIKKTRVDAIYGLVHLMDSAYDRAAEIKTPTLLLYGERDEVIPCQPVYETAAHIQAPLKTIYYANGYHMLLRDLQREKVMGDIVKWVKNRDQRSGSQK